MSFQSSNFLSPSSTVLRIKRKRGADPLAGLVVSSKRTKKNDLFCDNDLKQNDLSKSQEIIFRLIGTSELPNVKDAAPFLDKEHKVVEMVDFYPEKKVLGKPQISVLDHQYLEVMKAAQAINDFGLTEDSKKDYENASTAPLATSEIYNEDCLNLSDESKEYVFDFYSSINSKLRVTSEDCLEVRLPTDEELQLFYGEEEEDSEHADDDEDSNDENHYKNDYPDEDEFLRDENDTTSDDDSYDHYGDEKEEYNSYYDETNDEYNKLFS